MVLISTLSYCTRFCLCCLLVTLYFDMFCYRKNDLDMMISSCMELVIVRKCAATAVMQRRKFCLETSRLMAAMFHVYNKTVCLKTSPIEIEPEKKIQHK